MVLVPDFLGPAAHVFKRHTFRPRTVKAKTTFGIQFTKRRNWTRFRYTHTRNDGLDWKKQVFSFFLIWQYVLTLQLLPWKILIVYINEF